MIDPQNCEHCDREFPFDEAARTADGCYLCPQCDAAWRREFETCKHEWEPYHNDMGDPGQYCRQCHGFVCDDIFGEIFGLAP